MNGKNFDVFISYRRSDGTDKARILDFAFSIDDCRTFLDFKSLGTGAFDKRLENAVLDAPVFVMVLTPDYFARCNEKGDWVRKEIELALDNGKIIIPINYDGKVNCAPDYLDEEFRSRVGCHNFLDLYHGTSFNATVKDIFDKHIRPHVSTHSNNDGKAKVSIIADADCELILDDEIVATVQAGKTKQIFVERGEHFFTARSTEFSDVKEEIEKTIDDLSFKYSLKIKLEDKLQPLREEKRKKEEEERRRKEEAERLEREKREAEARKQIEEAVRWLVLNLPAHPKTLTGHSSSVISVCWSPDGKYLASGSQDKTVIMWDAKSGQELKIFEGHTDCVVSLYWSPDGKYLASRANDEIVIIWDADSGEKIKTFEGHSHDVECLYSLYGNVSWSPDGKYLASGSMDRNIIIWDANSGEKLKTLEGHFDNVEFVNWSPNGKYLASASWDKTIIIWDTNSGQRLKSLRGDSLGVLSVSWSPNGKYLASASDYGTVIIWDADSGEKLKTLGGHPGWVRSVCWSPDGKYLASGSEGGTVIIWDADSGKKLRTLEGHSDVVRSVCWSPDGKYLASGSMDETVIIWGAD